MGALEQIAANYGAAVSVKKTLDECKRIYATPEVYHYLQRSNQKQ
jgi:hypothetical protein